jgi:superfamily II DNA or RNA helicase
MAEPQFHVGQDVVLRSTRTEGRICSAAALDGAEYWYRVRFGARIENIVEEDLEVLDAANASIDELVLGGRWGRLSAFRSALTVERIQHSNRNTVYVFNAQRILFEPYQYKPLLKVLDSTDRRLLIADEVGLGKTIEAGLILRELEARTPLDKILIVCPSRLRQKWREELNRKFDQDFEIYDANDLRSYLARLREAPHRGRLRAIVSLNVLRRPELREEVAAGIDQLDAVVLDEAHHARNPGTNTAEMLRDLCQWGEAVILLTATPLQLGTEDLFTLLNALRPTEFREAAMFSEQLRRHRDVLKAYSVVRSRQPNSNTIAAQLLQHTFVEGTLDSLRDPVALQVIESLNSEPPSDSRGWLDLEQRVQDLHVLATILTRTRKREVQEHAAVRRAQVFLCQWTAEEEAAYERLVGAGAATSWFNKPQSFGQVMRSRQAASCLFAALERNAASMKLGDLDELTDDIPHLEPTEGDFAQSTEPIRYPNTDTKFEKFNQIISKVIADEPKAKILVFTFFKGTARYIENQLNRRGVATIRIDGDVPSCPSQPDRDERGRRIDDFREDPSIRVLVATEVGSEGLDFQFCHHLVNYDLPWNPMVVEQRIGRIDRYGQQSKIVYVHNLIVEGTVEDRILHRLYQRIGIFEHSIGDLEAILGETVRDLQRDYLNGVLTPEESQRRVDEAARAIERRRVDLDNLERNASDLFGHEDFIRDQVARIRRLGRFLSSESLIAVLSTFLESFHPDSGIWLESPDIYALRIASPLRQDLLDEVRENRDWTRRVRDGILRLTAVGELAFRDRHVELINASHPLIRLAVRRVSEQLAHPSARTAQAILYCDSDEQEHIVPGIYFILVWAQLVEGLRKRRLLEPVAISARDNRLLDAEATERLLHLLLTDGQEWDLTTKAPPIPATSLEALLSEARRRNRVLKASEELENEALYLRRSRVVTAEGEHRRRLIEDKLRTAREREREDRVLRLFEAQFDKVNTHMRQQIQRLAEERKTSVRISDSIAACVVDVRTRKRVVMSP